MVGLGRQGPGRGTYRVEPIPDDFARLSALQKGEVDIITNCPRTR